MPPVIYLFHGEDELSINLALRKLEGKAGDSAGATLNTVRLDGRNSSLDELRGAVSAIPFFGGRRLVILFNPLAKIENNPDGREKLINLLEKVPETTGLVLVEYRLLFEIGKEKNEHWLHKWAKGAGPRVLVRPFPALKGVAMEKFILRQAKAGGGEFSIKAAKMLAPLVDDDTRLANQEINKLLAYVNYQRPVEEEDVAAASAATGQADIFALVDALGNQKGQEAMSLLQRLLEEQDIPSLFGMIVRQFRLLILAREVMEDGGRVEDYLQKCRKDVKYLSVAKKVFEQATNFSLPVLEAIYAKLLEVDERIKTSQMEGDVALETFVAGLFTSPVS